MAANYENIKQQGFSLLELLIVVAILSILMAAVFNTLHDGLKKYKAEEARLNVTQESREFLDQIVRDLHSVGYPNLRMYNAGVLGATAQNSTGLAVGLVAVSATDIWFEGDVDDSGVVQSIHYTLQADANGNCPCTIRRSAAPKQPGSPSQVPPQLLSYNTQLQNVLNSVGGAGAYAIAGNTVFQGGSAPVSNDTLYATYKLAPVFSYFGQSGNAIAVPSDLQGSNLATGQAAIANVRLITIVLNLLSADQDLQTKLRRSVSMR